MTDERRPEDEADPVGTEPAPVEPEPAPVEPEPAPVEPEPAPVEPEPAGEGAVASGTPGALEPAGDADHQGNPETEPDAEALPDPDAPPRRRLLVVMAGILGVALLAAVVALGLQVKGNHDVTAGREDALAGARQMGVNFTSVSFDSLDVDIDNVVRLSTGGFQQEYSTQADAIRKVVKDQQVVSTGQVLRAGLSSWSGTKATALVIVDSTVRNKAQPGGSKIRYRLQIDLQKIDGRWLTSQIQFVL